MRNAYPESVQLLINQFLFVISLWARAAGEERAAVTQEIAIAALACPDGESVETYVARSVPKALGIRKIGNQWLGYDACLNSCELLDCDASTEELEVPATGLEIDCTSAIARHFGVSRRRAQQLVCAQVERAQACGDLFLSAKVAA